MAFFSSLFKKKSEAQAQQTENAPKHWTLFEEGQLMIDMYECADKIVVRTLAAGVLPEDLEISMYHDLLTVRGHRKEIEEIHDDRFFHRECYWGSFSRSVIIPTAVQQDSIRAYFKNGVVYIELPKLRIANATQDTVLTESTVSS